MKKAVRRKAKPEAPIVEELTIKAAPIEASPEAEKPRESCGLCHFWRENCCKRFPPTWTAGSEHAVHRVRAHPADWCGEYQAR